MNEKGEAQHNPVLTPSLDVPVHHDWGRDIRYYSHSLLISISMFVVLSSYVFMRRGFYDLFIANKIFAGVAALMIGIVLLMGPLSRMFEIFDRYLIHRKGLGITAFVYALLHSIVSFFLLPERFPMTRYFNEGKITFFFGLTAMIALTILFVLSWSKLADAIGRKRWWLIQNWGVRVAFLLVVFHVYIMKWKGWVTWYQIGGSDDLLRPYLPGASLLIAWFMLFVFIVRVAECVSIQWAKYTWYIGLATLAVIYVSTFWWGISVLSH